MGYYNNGMAPPWPTIIGAIAAVVVLWTAAPAVAIFIRNVLRRKGPVDEKTTYEDDDGVATKESEQAYATRWQRVALSILTILGLCAQIALVVVVQVNLASLSASEWYTLWSRRRTAAVLHLVIWVSTFIDYYFF